MRTSSSRPCVRRPRPSPATCAGTCWWTVSSPGTRSSTPRTGTGTVEVRRLLVHPRDDETGLRHGSLQMIHALGDDLFDPDEAAHHVALVREHLMGVDGVRLFDRPPPYSGGLMRHFQRAETATFVGREIGLMYVHAHLRWCEAMARWGDADALWLGILQVLPPATVAVVPGARPRQANTYPSSSDAACLDREDFAARYAEVLTGHGPRRGLADLLLRPGGAAADRRPLDARGPPPRRDGRDRPRPAVRGWTGSRPPCPSPGASCGSATAWATEATDRPPCVSADATSRAAGPRTLTASAVSSSTSPTSRRPCDRTATSSRSSCRSPPDAACGHRRPTTDDARGRACHDHARAEPLTVRPARGRGVPRPQRQRRHGPLRGPPPRPAVRVEDLLRGCPSRRRWA